MGAISWIVDALLYDETIAVAEEEQRAREREATPEERERDKEDGVDDQVWWRDGFRAPVGVGVAPVENLRASSFRADVLPR